MGGKPVWTEGLLVSQHHFQAQDRYHEELLQHRISLAQPFHWGVSLLEVDRRLLAAGQLALRQFAAVWPDGLVVDCSGPDGDPLPEARSFESHLPRAGDDLDVFVGIPLEGAANVAPAEASGGHRFVRTTRAVGDFNTGAAEQELDFAVAAMRIVFGDERRDRLATIPVAQLTRQADGKIVLRDAFVPPVLRIGAAPYLTGALGSLLGAMVARQRELVASRKQRSAASVELHSSDARRLWLLYGLNRSIPVLSHFVEHPHAHPEALYLALASLVSELSTFAPEPEPSIPRFDFLRLGDVFESLFTRALQLLALDAAPAYAEVPLQRRADGMFLGRLPDPRIANHEFFVALRASLPDADVRERVPQLLKVADWGRIVDVVKQARHGVRVEVEWNPSSALPLRPGLVFFRLRREGAFWEEVTKTGTLALCLPNEPTWKDATLQVYAVDPAQLR